MQVSCSPFFNYRFFNQHGKIHTKEISIKSDGLVKINYRAVRRIIWQAPTREISGLQLAPL